MSKRRLADLNAEICGGQGVLFDCPIHGHNLYAPFENPIGGAEIYDPAHPERVRWHREGETIETLTLSPSIRVCTPGYCEWHGFIRNGEVETLSDSK